MENFNKVVELLTAAKVPCKVKLTDGKDEIIVECGWNYPDEMFYRIMDAIGDINVSVCAEESGNKVISSRLISGGPKRYSYI